MIEKNIENIIEDDMMSYAAETLLNRALPNLEDGLKISYRRILWVMKEMNANTFKKSASVAGRTMFYHPHSTTYPSIVSMVQEDNQLHPLLNGKGSFGQYTSRDLAPAADRYTEVKLSEIALDMLKDLNKNSIRFIDNYDGTLKEPELIPVKFPYILLNSQEGIATGFASKLPSFNLNEICNAIINYLKTKKHTILIPDFATGGFIINNEEIFRQINKEGKGSIKLRGKVEIKDNEIIITEIPYGTTRESIIEKIVELAKNNKLKEILNINDLTGLNQMSISIETKRNTNMELLIEKLYKFTQLENNYNCNMNVLINNLPKVLGVHKIIEYWLIWRRQCIVKELIYKVSQLNIKLELLEGLKIISSNIEEVIDIIRMSKNNEIENNLKLKFMLTSEQSSDIANMKLKNINKEYIKNKIIEIEDIKKEVNQIRSVILNTNKINKIIISELEEIKNKFGQSRKTKLVDNIISINIEDEKNENEQNYNIKVYLTKDGYCFKFKTSSTQALNLKPGDNIIKEFETFNNNDLIVFDNNQTFYKIPFNKIEETTSNSLGYYLPRLINEKIKILNYSLVDDKYKYILIIYKNGKINKIPNKLFNLNKKIIKKAYNDKNEVFDILSLKEDIDLIIYTNNSKFNLKTKDIPIASSRITVRSSITRNKEITKIE